MTPENIRKKILEKTSSLERFGMNDLTCDKEDALTLISSLMDDDIGIFGGSVYKLELDELIQMYDSWYCNPLSEENRSSFNLRSKSEALNYISKYPVYPGEKIIFSLVFTENVDT